MPNEFDDLTALIENVKAELHGVLKVEAAKLAKAHPGEETPAEVPPDNSATDDGSADASASAPPADDSAPPSDASASAASPDPTADPTQDPAAGGDDVDPDALYAELAQLPIEHVKTLYLAAKQVLFAHAGAGDMPGDDMGASAAPAASPDVSPAPAASPSPPPAAPPVAPPAASPDAPPEKKDEMSVSKSEHEAELAALKKNFAELEAITSGLMTALETAIKVPARRAITSVVELGKSEQSAQSLSKSEVKTRIDRAARTNLNGMDRDLINKYAVGAIGVEGIKHLLDIK